MKAFRKLLCVLTAAVIAAATVVPTQQAKAQVKPAFWENLEEEEEYGAFTFANIGKKYAAVTGYNQKGSCVSLDIPSVTPDGREVVSIAAYAFANMTNLKEVSIPSTVTGIGDGAFLNCTGLEFVAIPASVTTIGMRVFSGCSGLKAIGICGNPSLAYEALGDSFKHVGTYTRCQRVIDFCMQSDNLKLMVFSDSSMDSKENLSEVVNVSPSGRNQTMRIDLILTWFLNLFKK